MCVNEQLREANDEVLIKLNRVYKNAITPEALATTTAPTTMMTTTTTMLKL